MASTEVTISAVDSGSLFTVTETTQGNRCTGDCFDVLPTHPPASYDLLLTDPP